MKAKTYPGVDATSNHQLLVERVWLQIYVKNPKKKSWTFFFTNTEFWWWELTVKNLRLLNQNMRDASRMLSISAVIQLLWWTPNFGGSRTLDWWYFHWNIHTALSKYKKSNTFMYLSFITEANEGSWAKIQHRIALNKSAVIKLHSVTCNNMFCAKTKEKTYTITYFLWFPICCRNMDVEGRW